MAHYAFITDKIVTEVIVGIHETETIEGSNTETWYGIFRGQVCKRSSYNNKIRYNFAGIGFTYDEVNDAFIAPKPKCGHDELTLNTADYRWYCENVEHDLN